MVNTLLYTLQKVATMDKDMQVRKIWLYNVCVDRWEAIWFLNILCFNNSKAFHLTLSIMTLDIKHFNHTVLL